MYNARTDTPKYRTFGGEVTPGGQERARSARATRVSHTHARWRIMRSSRRASSRYAALSERPRAPRERSTLLMKVTGSREREKKVVVELRVVAFVLSRAHGARATLHRHADLGPHSPASVRRVKRCRISSSSANGDSSWREANAGGCVQGAGLARRGVIAHRHRKS